MRADFRDGQRTIRTVGGVADVDDVLVGQLVDDRAGDGQPADSGVEDADGRSCRTHGVRYGFFTATLRRSRSLRSGPESRYAAKTPAMAPHRWPCHETPGVPGNTPKSTLP